MSEHDPQLPDELRKALKDSPTFTQPESFYTNVLRDIPNEDARLRSAPSRWAWIWGTPMKLAATTGIIMISYFAIHDDTPWGPKKADVVYDQFSSVSRAPVMAQAPALSWDKKEMAPLNKIVNASLKDHLGARTASKGDALKNLQPMDADVAVKKAASEASSSSLPALRERADAPERKRVAGTTFPWQSNLQAKQMESEPAALSALDSGGRLGSAYTENASDKASSMTKEKNARLFRDEASGSWSGPDSRITFFRTAVITTAADWTVLWREHATSPAPTVDFEQWIVVGLFAGSRSDVAELSIVTIQTQPDQILVVYREIPRIPNRGDPLTITPYVLRSIAKTSLPVHFKKIP